MTQERTPPYDQESEVAVLGSILQEDQRVLSECHAAGVVSESFYVPAHRTIFGAMLDLNMRGKVIDALTLSKQLEGKHELERAGGLTYLTKLIDDTPSVVNSESYIEIVRDKGQRRQIIQLSRDAEQSAYDLDRESGELLNEAQRNFFQASKMAEGPKTNTEAANEEIDSWKAAMAGSGRGLKCFLEGYTDVMGGFRKGKTHYIGGASTMGKTTWLKNQLRYLSYDLKIPTAFASIDDEHTEVLGSIACEVGDVSKFQLDHGRVELRGEKRGSRLRKAYGAMKMLLSKRDDGSPNFPLYINDSIFDFDQFESWTRYMVFKHGVEAVGLDYVQILEAGKRCKAKTQREILEYLGRNFRRLAKDTNVAMFLISQVAEEHGQKKTKEPTTTRLFGSSGLYHAAYTVTMIREEDKAYVIQCTKNKGGPQGSITASFRKERQRFEREDSEEEEKFWDK